MSKEELRPDMRPDSVRNKIRIENLEGWTKNFTEDMAIKLTELEEILRDDYKFKIEKLPDNELKKHYEKLLKKLDGKMGRCGNCQYKQDSYVCKSCNENNSHWIKEKLK